MYRAPNFGVQLANQQVQSSISGILAASPATDSSKLKIVDPNSQNKNSYLEGADAFNKIISKSSLGKVSLGYGIPNYFAQLEESTTTDSGSGHGDTTTTTDPTNVSSGTRREVAIKSSLKAEEAAIYEERIALLRATNMVSDHSFLMFNFDIDKFKLIPANYTIYETNSYDFLDKKHPKLDRTFAKNLTGQQKAYVSASLIELLLQLDSKNLYVKGGLGLSRGFVGSNFSQIEDGGSISDHAFGRGFDIDKVGTTAADAIDLSTGNVEDYKKGLTKLLDALVTVDPSLHPDLIVIHNGLKTEYGIIKGFEGDIKTGPLYKKYPELKKINFHCDANHNTHIHVSFGPMRAGTYESWLETNTSPGGSGGSGGPEPSGNALSRDELFTPFTDGSGVKNTNALYRALVDYGEFSPETAALWMMIAERESGGDFSPRSFASDSDDYSIGLWQLNYSETTGSTFVYRDTYAVERDARGALKKTKIPIWKLVLKDHATLKVKDAAGNEVALRNGADATKIISEFRKKGKGVDEADPRIYKPINQIFLLCSYVQDYRKFKNGWYFTNWGEYANGPTYGWITNTKFETAVKFYTANNPGKTRDDLVKHCKGLKKNMIVNAGKQVYERWLNGEYFEWET